MNRRFLTVLAFGLPAMCVLGIALDEPVRIPTAYADQDRADGDTSVADNPATEPLPAYLQYLQEKVRTHLEEKETGDDDLVVQPATTRYQQGPISRVEYREFVGDAELSGSVDTDSVSLTRPVIPRVVLTDRDALAYLFQCCAYNEAAADSIAFAEIYDFSRSGFSNGDLLVIHPSGNSYILQGLSSEFLDQAATWKQAGHLEYKTYHRETRYMGSLVDELSAPVQYDWDIPEPDLPRELEAKMALRAIWGAVHQSVEQQYGLSSMELYFTRDDTTTSIELWGFAPDSLQFNYLNTGDGVARNDLLTVTVRDTVIESVHNYVDLLVVRDSRRDTLYTHSP